MKTGLNNLSEDEIRDVENALDPYSFEKFCGQCIFFDTEDCPHLGKVCALTEWKLKLGSLRKNKPYNEINEIQCDKFFD